MKSRKWFRRVLESSGLEPDRCEDEVVASESEPPIECDVVEPGLPARSQIPQSCGGDFGCLGEFEGTDRAD